MASDIHLKLGDIKGESTDDKHKDTIDVLSWSWGMSNATQMATGGGGGVGKVNFHDLTFTHYVDKASPNIMKMCATGEHLKEATLMQRKQGKTPQEYLVIKLSDVMVSSVSDGGSGGGESPTENVALAFAKVDLEYKPQKADGSLDAGVHFKFDIKANKEG
jgi:type VI secretion system secreted protein Hcp